MCAHATVASTSLKGRVTCAVGDTACPAHNERWVLGAGPTSWMLRSLHPHLPESELRTERESNARLTAEKETVSAYVLWELQQEEVGAPA